jgi:hypothetical protein
MFRYLMSRFIKQYLALLMLGMLAAGAGLPSKPEAKIITEPLKLEWLEGFFALTRNTVIQVNPGSIRSQRIGRQLADQLSRATGFTLPFGECSGNRNQAPSVVLTIRESSSSLGAEGYELEVLPPAESPFVPLAWMDSSTERRRCASCSRPRSKVPCQLLEMSNGRFHACGLSMALDSFGVGSCWMSAVLS